MHKNTQPVHTAALGALMQVIHTTNTTNRTPCSTAYLQALWRTGQGRSQSKTSPRPPQNDPTHTWRHAGQRSSTQLGMRTQQRSCHCIQHLASPARRRTSRLGSPCNCWQPWSTSTDPRHTVCKILPSTRGTVGLAHTAPIGNMRNRTLKRGNPNKQPHSGRKNHIAHSEAYLLGLWRTDPQNRHRTPSRRPPRIDPTRTWRQSGWPSLTLVGMHTPRRSHRCTRQPAGPACRRTCRLGSPCSRWPPSSMSTGPTHTMCMTLHGTSRCISSPVPPTRCSTVGAMHKQKCSQHRLRPHSTLHTLRAPRTNHTHTAMHTCRGCGELTRGAV
jgi:hypothetical protein